MALGIDDIRYLEILPKEVRVAGGFWQAMMEKARTQVIPYQWEALNDRIPDAEPSYCMRNFRIAAGREQGVFDGRVFQDSDFAKWIEAVAYSLMWHPDAALEQLADGAIAEVVAAQQPDGYLNTYYIINGLDKRFTNLRDNHELYCLGHMIEGAVAYYQATGKRVLLDAMVRYVDLVDSLIGPEDGKLHGYPGHEEIELALVRLYRVTGNQKHLALAKYFIDERGKQPLFFEQEEQNNQLRPYWPGSHFGYEYSQSAQPVRDQQSAVGHAVRAMYLYTGMVDVAKETQDETLLAACRRLWQNVVHRQMYITGSIGSTAYGESFSFDYNLPNDLIYSETCATIGLAFFARRMLDIEADSQYADVLETALYNGIISGMSASGTNFFYVNPLEVWPEANLKDQPHRHVKVQRPKWFGCACCPPNLARLLTSLGSYAYTKQGDCLYIHLYMDNTLETTLDSGAIKLVTSTNYPWDGTIKLEVVQAPAATVSLALRIPGWCGKFTLAVNGAPAKYTLANGYAVLPAQYKTGDSIELVLDMPVRVMEANPRVREDIGKLAVARGPMVYCLEEEDNGPDLHRLLLHADTAFTLHHDADFLASGAMLLQCPGKRVTQASWGPDELYRPVAAPVLEDITLRFIPYYLWANRKPGEMIVWVRRA